MNYLQQCQQQDQQQHLFGMVTKLNNEGVNQLHIGNMEAALSAFQNGTVIANNIMIQQQYRAIHHNSVVTVPFPPSSSCTSSKEDYHDSCSDDLYGATNSKAFTFSPQVTDLSSASASYYPIGLGCTPGKNLARLNDGNYYIYDCPFEFSSNFSDMIHHSLSDDTSAIISIIIISFNFALTCHQNGKVYGRTQSYLAASELYYLVWSVSQQCCQNQEQLKWHTMIQCLVLNNLVHLHYELNEFVESEICMTCLRELLVSYPSYDDCNPVSPVWIMTTNEYISSSTLFRHVFEQIQLNLIYFCVPTTARAA
jgi:hypothetical protein